MSWQKVPLGELAVTRGGSVNPAKFPDETFELFSIPAYDDGAAEVCPGSAIGSSKKYVEENDVLISRIVPHIRRSWVVGPSKGYRQIASGEWIQFRSSDVFPEYLRHFLMADPFHSQFMRTVSGVGGSLLRARPAEVYKIPVPIPPLKEQKRIAKILDAADALRAKRRESLAQLDALLQSAFLDLFGDPVSNPKNWQARPLGEMMRIRRGGSPRPIDKYLGGSVNWIKIGDATRSGDDIYISSCAEKITEEGLSKTTFLEEGSFVFANSGVSLGFARILKVKGAIHDGWLAFDQFSDDLLNKLFFLKALNQITLHFRRMAPSGTQPNLNTGIMKSFMMIVPPIELQNQFAKFVEGVERQKALLRNHLEELDLLMGSLQRETFSMEL